MGITQACILKFLSLLLKQIKSVQCEAQNVLLCFFVLAALFLYESISIVKKIRDLFLFVF